MSHRCVSMRAFVGVALLCGMGLSGCAIANSQDQINRLEQQQLELQQERNRLESSLAASEGQQASLRRELQRQQAELNQLRKDREGLVRASLTEAELAERDRELEKFRSVPGVEAEREPTGDIRLTVNQAILFPTGSAEVSKVSKTLDGIASILKEKYPGASLRVDGHTDNVPVKKVKDRYPSNWELSSARSSAVVRYLISKDAADPSRCTVTGSGEFQPVATNVNEDGRKRNRRVEIFVTPGGQ
ncbi:MAG: flagellar motor protein MotB [Planctomycetota bacterium]